MSQLTTGVLHQIAKEDMQTFFQWYLRNDVRAQLLFLTRFSDNIPVEESEKYEWLFYKSIQLLRGSAAYLGLSKQKTLLKIYDELYMQAADAMVRHHYVKTFYILTNGLTFIRLLQRKERSLHSEFTTTVENYLMLLFRLHESDLPRDLIQQLIDFVDAENACPHPLINKSYHTFPRLKIRIEYLHNGLDALLDFIQMRWTLSEFKNTESLGELFYTLFSESWSIANIDTFTHLKIPREVWKNTLYRLHRHELNYEIELLWETFELGELFSNPKHSPFVQRILNQKQASNPHLTSK